jgi:hypothetical protein
MSDWRSLSWRSGGLKSALLLDRQGLNANTREGYLPLETPATGGTTTYVISANTTGTYTNNGLTNVEVTKIRELNNTTSYAGSTSGGVVSWAVGDREHTLIRFNDLSGIGAGTVTNAEVGFYVINTDSSSKDIEIRALTQAWDYFNTTWDEYSSGITWDTAGALGVGDRGSVLATATATGSTGYWVQFSGSAVDTWVQNCIAGTDVYESLYVGYVNDTAYSNIYEEFEYSLGTNGFRPYLSFDWVASGGGGGTTNSSGDPASYISAVLSGTTNIRTLSAPSAYTYSAINASASIRVITTPNSYAYTPAGAASSVRGSAPPSAFNDTTFPATARLNISGSVASFIYTPNTAVASILGSGALATYTITAVDGTGSTIGGGVITPSSGDPSGFTITVSQATARLNISATPAAYVRNAIVASARISIASPPSAYSTFANNATASIRTSGAGSAYSNTPLAATIQISLSGAVGSYAITAVDGSGSITTLPTTIISSGDVSDYLYSAAPATALLILDPSNVTISTTYHVPIDGRTINVVKSGLITSILVDDSTRQVVLAADNRTLLVEKPIIPTHSESSVRVVEIPLDDRTFKITKRGQNG